MGGASRLRPSPEGQRCRERTRLGLRYHTTHYDHISTSSRNLLPQEKIGDVLLKVMYFKVQTEQPLQCHRREFDGEMMIIQMPNCVCGTWVMIILLVSDM